MRRNSQVFSLHLSSLMAPLICTLLLKARAAGFLELILSSHDSVMPAFAALNEVLSRRKDEPSAFEIGQHGDVDFYTWLETHPVQFGAFHRFMEAQFSSLPSWLDAVPFDTDYAQSINPETLIFVDVGGAAVPGPVQAIPYAHWAYSAAGSAESAGESGYQLQGRAYPPKIISRSSHSKVRGRISGENTWIIPTLTQYRRTCLLFR